MKKVVFLKDLAVRSVFTMNFEDDAKLWQLAGWSNNLQMYVVESFPDRRLVRYMLPDRTVVITPLC